MAISSTASDPYEVLQVAHTAEPEVIRAAYRALAGKWHPDRGASPERMIAINEAWRTLSDPARRATYDRTTSRMASSPSRMAVPMGAAEPGLPARRPHETRATENVLDFGRYTGWTVDALVDHDPDYLVWLARTPIGRRLTPAIDAALVRREAQATDLAPRHAQRHRPFLRRRMVEAR